MPFIYHKLEDYFLKITSRRWLPFTSMHSCKSFWRIWYTLAPTDTRQVLPDSMKCYYLLWTTATSYLVGTLYVSACCASPTTVLFNNNIIKECPNIYKSPSLLFYKSFNYEYYY